jgi:hypothetical protein
MESVYVETTFISYLVARPSRDVIVAGHQQTTQDWWANRRSQFECYVSQVVIDESSAGDPNESQKRLAIIANLPALNLTTETEALTEAILRSGVLPSRAARDAAHVGVATGHGVDYLLTWNCKHLANADYAKNRIGLCQVRLSDAAHLHTRRINGSLTMWEDPIVAEVHRIREQLAAEFNFDVKAMFADMRKRQAALGSRLVSRNQSAEPAAEADRGRDSGSSGSSPSNATPAA